MTATIELYANNAYSTIAATLSSSATSMTVATSTGSRFPSPTGNQFFRLTLTSHSSPNTIFEIVYVTARSGDVLTITRGQEGSTAQSWAISDLCGNVPTAGMLNQFQQPSVGIDTGSVNAYVVSTPQHETSYYTGMPLTFYTLHANTTTAPTLNLNGLGASTIKNADGSALLSGQLQANVPISVAYNTNDSSWRLVSPLGLPTGLTPSRAVGTDPSGRLTAALPSLSQLNLLANWTNAIQTNIGSGTGWTINPQGLILQWGNYVTSTNPSQTVTFPIAFPNAFIQGWATQGNASSSNWGIGFPDISAVHGTTATTTQMEIFSLAWQGSGWTGSNGLGIYWYAIGY